MSMPEDLPRELADQLNALPGFWDTHWRRRPAVYPSAWKIGGIPTLDEIDDILRYSVLRFPFVTMYSRGRSAPVTSFSGSRETSAGTHVGYLDYTKAMAMFESGYAIELGAMQHWHPQVSRIAEAMGQAFGAEVDAQIFVTPPGVQGISVHRDRADAFAVQIAGRKSWKLYEKPTDPYWEGGAVDDPGELVLETVLSPGDVLCFSAGNAHEVKSVDSDPSAHITFGVRHINGPVFVEVFRSVLTNRLHDSGLSGRRPLDAKVLNTVVGQALSVIDVGRDHLVDLARSWLVARNYQISRDGLTHASKALAS